MTTCLQCCNCLLPGLPISCYHKLNKQWLILLLNSISYMLNKLHWLHLAIRISLISTPRNEKLSTKYIHNIFGNFKMLASTMSQIINVCYPVCLDFTGFPTYYLQPKHFSINSSWEPPLIIPVLTDVSHSSYYYSFCYLFICYFVGFCSVIICLLNVLFVIFRTLFPYP